jgi:hypothetical protein
VFKLNRRAAVPEPYEDVKSLFRTCMAMKELTEELAGQRGDPRNAAVTWQDLIDLGLVKPAEIPQGIGSPNLQQRTSR